MATIKELIPISTTSLSGTDFSPGEAALLGGGILSSTGTVVADACVTTDSNLDVTGFRNITASSTGQIGTASGGTITDGVATLSGGVLTGATFSTTTFDSPVFTTQVTGDAFDTSADFTGSAMLAHSTAIATYVSAAVSDAGGGNVNATSTLGSNSSIILADGSSTRNIKTSSRFITDSAPASGSGAICDSGAVYDFVVANIGSVAGPGSSVNNQLAVFNGTSGNIIKQLAAGSTGEVLTMGSGLPGWAAPSTVYSGSSSSVPAGWGIEANFNTDVGRWRITHDLSTTSLSIVVTCRVGYQAVDSSYVATAASVDADTIDVTTKWLTDSGVTAISIGFSFMVSEYT
jgi:hypothetical protein